MPKGVIFEHERRGHAIIGAVRVQRRTDPMGTHFKILRLLLLQSQRSHAIVPDRVRAQTLDELLVLHGEAFEPPDLD